MQFDCGGLVNSLDGGGGIAELIVVNIDLFSLRPSPLLNEFYRFETELS